MSKRRPDTKQIVSRLNVLRDKEAKDRKKGRGNGHSAFTRVSLARAPGSGYLGLEGRKLLVHRYDDATSHHHLRNGILVATFTIESACQPDQTEKRLRRIAGSLHEEDPALEQRLIEKFELELLPLGYETDRLTYLSLKESLPWYFVKDPAKDSLPAGEARILSHDIEELSASRPQLLIVVKELTTALLRILPQLGLFEAKRIGASESAEEKKRELAAAERNLIEAEGAFAVYRDELAAKEKELQTLPSQISDLQAQIDRTTGPGTAQAKLDLQRKRWAVIDRRRDIERELKDAVEKIAARETAVAAARAAVDELRPEVEFLAAQTEAALKRLTEYTF